MLYGKNVFLNENKKLNISILIINHYLITTYSIFVSYLREANDLLYESFVLGHLLNNIYTI